MNKKTGWFLVFLVFSCFSPVICNNENQVYLRLIQNDKNILNFFNPQLSAFKELIKRVLQDGALDKECENSLISIDDGLERKEAWALKYLESNGAARAGFLTGYHHDLGNLDGCISIESRRSVNGDLFSGQFCLISIQTPFNEAMRRQSAYRMLKRTLSNSSREMIDFALGRVQGFCIPSTCEVKQLLRPVNKVLAAFELEAIPQLSCSSGIKVLDFLDLKFLLCLTVLCIPAGLSALTLLYESEFLKPFSLKDNLWSIYVREEKSEMAFIHGFRFLYLWCSIPAHLLGLFYVFGMASFLTSGAKSMNWFAVKPLIDRMLLGIEFMFFVSGVQVFLTVYEPIKRKKSNIIQTLLRWPIQVYPSYVGYICLFTVLSYFAIPYGDVMSLFLANCRTVGWKLFTFTSNLDHLIDSCVITGWFNSVNAQISLLHYALLFIFLKGEMLGVLLSTTLLCANLLYEAYRMFAEELPPIMEITTGDSLQFYNLERDYLSFSSHLSPFTVGFLCGWIYMTKKLTFLKNPIVAHTLAPISFVLSFGVVVFPEAFSSGLVPKFELLLVSNFALKRIIVVLFPATMLFVFKAGHLKSVKKWLSIRPLVAVSRLAPTLIVCQFIYFLFMLSISTQVFRFNFINLAKEILFSLTTIFVLANLFFFFFEAPVCRLLKKYTVDRMAARAVALEINNNEVAAKKKHNPSE